MRTIVSRQTSKGLLLVTIEGTTLSTTLASAPLGRGCASSVPVSRIPSPFAGPTGERMTHSIGCAPTSCALYASEAKAIEVAMCAETDAERAAELATLPGQRKALAMAVYNCTPGARPESEMGRRESAALAALAAFDLAHPEVR